MNAVVKPSARTQLFRDLGRLFERFKSIEVVPFTASYLADVMVSAREIHEHSIDSVFPFNQQKLIRQLLTAGTPLARDRYCRLAVRGHRVMGVCHGRMQRAGAAMVASDLAWWVRPAAFNGATAMRLLADFECWARQQGSHRICLELTDGSDQAVELLEQRGYRFNLSNASKDLA